MIWNLTLHEIQVPTLLARITSTFFSTCMFGSLSTLSWTMSIPPLGLQHPQQQAFSMDFQNDTVSKPISVIACISLALLYVVTL
jgi:hypothetical protein